MFTHFCRSLIKIDAYALIRPPLRRMRKSRTSFEGLEWTPSKMPLRSTRKDAGCVSCSPLSMRTSCTPRVYANLWGARVQRARLLFSWNIFLCITLDQNQSLFFPPYCSLFFQVSRDRICIFTTCFVLNRSFIYRARGSSSSSVVMWVIRARFLTRPQASPSGVSAGHSIPHCDGCNARGPLT